MLGRKFREYEREPGVILVDTSVWIDFFDYPDSRHAQELKNLINKDEELCLVDLNVTEILQGINDERIFNDVKTCLMQFPVLRARGLATYIFAANLYRACRKKGKTVSKTIDMIIAAIAIENQVAVFHKDKDFDLIASCTKLKIFNF